MSYTQAAGRFAAARTTQERARTTMGTDLPGIRLGIVRGIGYGLFGAPDSFVPAARALGAGLVRAYVYWGQVEPEPGRYDWTVVDALLAQLDPAAETWVTVCCSSPWATRTPTGFLPASPARDADRYARFVAALVTRCAGRVTYWQCDNEPSNTDLLWAGTAAEYVAQLAVFQRSVRGADPAARVVLGGCGHDVLSDVADGPARRFFDHVLGHGRDAFDLFSVHLYGDPHAIPRHLETVRGMMRRHGYERPVLAGEYNGPTLFELPCAQEEFGKAMAEAFGVAPEGGEASGEQAPDRDTMRRLYARADRLPPELRMFMDNCPPALTAKRERITSRQLVTRNVLALAGGVTRTVCWNLAPEGPGHHDPFNLMGFLFGTLALMDFEGTSLVRRAPADTFARLTALFDGVTAVRRVASPHYEDVFAHEVARTGRPPLHVLWRAADVWTGEDEPAVPVRWPWPHPTAHTVDAFGARTRLSAADGRLRVPVSVTPVFLSAEVEAGTEKGR
jgi:hypothetical protein